MSFFDMQSAFLGQVFSTNAEAACYDLSGGPVVKNNYMRFKNMSKLMEYEGDYQDAYVARAFADQYWDMSGKNSNEGHRHYRANTLHKKAFGYCSDPKQERGKVHPKTVYPCQTKASTFGSMPYSIDNNDNRSKSSNNSNSNYSNNNNSASHRMRCNGCTRPDWNTNVEPLFCKYCCTRLTKLN